VKQLTAGYQVLIANLGYIISSQVVLTVFILSVKYTNSQNPFP